MTEQKQKSPKKSKKKPPKKSKKKPPKKPTKMADYRKFVEYYAIPSVYRQEKYGFRTEQEFAKHFDLSQDTLTDWKKRPDFSKDVDKLLMQWGEDKTPDVIASLYRTILKEGKASEVKLWLQFIKQWKEGMVIERPDFDMAQIAKTVRKVNKEDNERKTNKSNK